MSGRAWLLVIVGLFLAFGSLAWWQQVEAACDGTVARGMWNQPVCTEGNG